MNGSIFTLDSSGWSPSDAKKAVSTEYIKDRVMKFLVLMSLIFFFGSLGGPIIVTAKKGQSACWRTHHHEFERHDSKYL